MITNNIERRYEGVLFRWSLKKRKSNKNKKNSLPGNVSKTRVPAPRGSGGFPGRAALCISGLLKKGSLTLEAAMALPLFFLTVVSLISLLGVYASFVQTTVKLQQRAEEAGSLGIYAAKESGAPVQLLETVKAELPFLPFPVKGLSVRAGGYVLPWTGRSDYSSLEAATSEEGKLYYLSDYQSVYHTSSSCSYLSLHISAVPDEKIKGLHNEEGKKYKACDLCVGEGDCGQTVFVTENGDHYHNSPECNGLKRSVHLVDVQAVSGLHMCSRCAKKEQIS